MQAGHLTERITIEQLVEGVDPIGQPVSQWQHYLDAWADIAHLSGLETIRADAQVSQVKTSIRIRRRPGRNVKASMRVTHGTTVYSIQAVLPNRRSNYLDLICTTENPQ
ncbi:phage head closure protein [Pusillimonas sp. TS35]|nr:phage head closure protein [Pusillimonas sp. TS35]